MPELKSLFPDPFYTSLAAWFRRHARDLPWRRTTNPYAIMVSEFMLQQTQVATVIPFFERWMRRFPTLESLAAAPEQEVLAQWQGLGYYSRARNLQRAARIAGSRLPDSLAEMKALPGMGDYTAGAILTFSGNARVPIVDANIARVLARLFDFQEPIDSTAGRRKIWSLAAQSLPADDAGAFNAALMELGALVCTPRPKCEACPVSAWCLALQSGKNPAQLPIKIPKIATTQKLERALFIQNEHRIALVQRKKNPWQDMWVLPEMPNPPDPLEMPLLTHRYGITRYRVDLEIYPAISAENVTWFTPEELAALPIPSPHRRVLEALSGGP